MAKDPPICKKCGSAHWRFKECIVGSEPTPPAVSAWPEDPPEGLHHPQGFGDPPNMLDASLARAGFGAAPATIGYTRPRKRS